VGRARHTRYTWCSVWPLQVQGGAGVPLFVLNLVHCIIVFLFVVICIIVVVVVVVVVP
jgi:hypothetical protein